VVGDDERWTLGEAITLVLCAVLGVVLAVAFTNSPDEWWFVPTMLKP
jgi:hypothetical protein